MLNKLYLYNKPAILFICYYLASFITRNPAQMLKAKLLFLYKEQLLNKIRNFQILISQVQESANSDTKSSMGDKYETGRAMAQLEIEKNTAQLAELKRQLTVLERISPDLVPDTVRTGSLVITDQGNFLISFSGGPMELEGSQYIAVSPESPIAKSFAGKTCGDACIVNGRKFTIKHLI